MSKHLFGLVCTPYGVAANNRGENDGNITTLQKVLWNGEVHTTVSAEAIRWAIRYYWQRKGLPVNRKWVEEKNDHEWNDPRWLAWTDPEGKGKGKPRYIDDDVLGYMVAEAAADDGSDSAGSAIKRRGPLEVTRAISLTPFAGDITFNAKSGTKTNTSLYGTEVHATRYQYGFALTPQALHTPSNAVEVVNAVTGLSEVAGNQSRFLFDFSPDAVLFRLTDDFAPRLLYGFEMAGQERLNLPNRGPVVVELLGAERTVGRQLHRDELRGDAAAGDLLDHSREHDGARECRDDHVHYHSVRLHGRGDYLREHGPEPGRDQ